MDCRQQDTFEGHQDELMSARHMEDNRTDCWVAVETDGQQDGQMDSRTGGRTAERSAIISLSLLPVHQSVLLTSPSVCPVRLSIRLFHAPVHQSVPVVLVLN